MKKALAEYAETKDFRKFHAKTKRSWNRLGKYLLKRWRCPAGVELEDVVQELLVAAVTAVETYDPAKGIALNRYVVWNACAAAKKWMHTQRAALQRSDHSPSRHPIAASRLHRVTEEEDPFFLDVPIEAHQETNIALVKAVERVCQGQTKRYEAAFTLLNCDMNKSKTVATLLESPICKFSQIEATQLVNDIANELRSIIEVP